MDQLNLTSWIGRDIEDEGTLTVSAAAMIHATVGAYGTNAPRHGELLPGLWHWCAFPPLTHVEHLGDDGHPGPGALLPPVRLKRRMWAGGALQFHGPLRVGDMLRRQSSVKSIVEKTGATGPLVLVTLDHKIFGPTGLAVEERQDIVFLDVPDTFTPPKKRDMPRERSETVAITAPLLFRYSAITFNAHRIHYDLDYTRRAENYPDLVVHGPLQATLLMRHAVEKAGRMPTHFDFRGVHPMFASSSLDLCATDAEDGSMALFAGQDGHQGMVAHAIWEGVQ